MLNSPAVAIVSAIVSMLAAVFGLWVFALPAAVIALAFKLVAIHAMAATHHAERCRDRFGLALLFDTVALLAVGPGLFDRAQVVVVLIGLLGLAGTFLAWLSASSRATAQRHRWGIEHRTRRHDSPTIDAFTSATEPRPRHRTDTDPQRGRSQVDDPPLLARP